MPDETHQTVSASQVAALFDESRYETRFSLWHRFRGVHPPDEENSRMTWGKRMQPLVLDQAAADLALEVTPNDKDTYIRNGSLGCTRDAVVHCPDRGAGALETKCVFDYSVWMNRWTGGTAPPRDIEMQLQCQMWVGDGTDPFTWGVIAAWVCGDMYYFERTPEAKLIARMQNEAQSFLIDVAKGHEPDPAGTEVEDEDEVIKLLYPEADRDEVIELDNIELGNTVRMYHWAKGQESLGKKTAAQLRSKILNASKDHRRMRVPGAWVNVSRTTTEEQLANHEGQVIRKANTRTTLKVEIIEGENLDPPAQEIVA